MREGVQVCEAILFIQRGLDTGKLSPDLVARADKALDERSKRLMDSWVLKDKSGKTWFEEATMAATALENENELFAVAAAVAKIVK